MVVHDSCGFCAIVAGVAPARVVAETPTSVSFLPDVPSVLGHVLAVTRDHVRDHPTRDSLGSSTAYWVCVSTSRDFRVSCRTVNGVRHEVCRTAMVLVRITRSLSCRV